jgi:AraC-like DNA-binding protein
MRTFTGTGSFVSWDGGCMLIGRAHTITPMHAHYAIQVAFGVEAGIRFRPDDREPWTPYGGVVIPSRQPHTMDATCVRGNVVIFVEPETREGRALVERFPHGGIQAVPHEAIASVASALFVAWQAGAGPAAIVTAGQRIISALTGGVEPLTTSDERILRAIAHINAHINGAVTLEQVADVACLSPSRFRHLFVEETGMALRPYVLWRRFVRVWDLLAGGTSVSEAAHATGFADGAHLSRTSVRMFGFPPSALQLTGPLPLEARARDTEAGEGNDR